MVKQSRTMLQRAKAIFKLIDKEVLLYTDNRIPKSKFQDIGISPKDIDQWLDLILFIQQMPKLVIKKEAKKTYVDVLDSKFMVSLKNRMYDPELNYEERSSAALMYLKILINIERSKGEEINWKELITDPWEISRPTIIRLAEEGEEMMKESMK